MLKEMVNLVHPIKIDDDLTAILSLSTQEKMCLDQGTSLT